MRRGITSIENFSKCRWPKTIPGINFFLLVVIFIRTITQIRTLPWLASVTICHRISLEILLQGLMMHDNSIHATSYLYPFVSSCQKCRKKQLNKRYVLVRHRRTLLRFSCKVRFLRRSNFMKTQGPKFCLKLIISLVLVENFVIGMRYFAN